MEVSELLAYCASKPGAQQSEHRDWNAIQFKVNEVLFAMFYEVGGRPAIDLKSSPTLADMIRDQHGDVQASTYLNPLHWNTVLLDGSLNDSQIYYLVDASLQQVQR
ncbi:MmcQ/YjbR family DNA-binding protein [Erwinia amylovora]|uniref:MmcQ/YjbR family DNA-binding protein n=1 Tax=Erwinia amylovora TaxID=552 RepID=UPI000C06AB54|nr:MmcQ/YjbR family DNA-binding protein [Erwinia amylovora]